MSQNITEVKENRMGTQSIGSLLFSMSMPIVISMLVQACYNIVDSIFVSRISENALTAVSMAFPIQTLMIAVSTGTGVGINSLLSRSLGEGNRKNAQAAACNGLFLAFLSYFIFLIFGIFGTVPFYRAQINDPEIIALGKDYLSIVCMFSFGQFFQIAFERIMQSTGKTIYNMITQGLGAIINIIFDPILIFGLCGFPKMGIAGAAIATVAGQIIAAILGYIFNKLKNDEVSVSMKGFKPNPEIINKLKNDEVSVSMKGFKPNPEIIAIIYRVGIPSILMQSITSILTFFMNIILAGFSSTAVTILGVYFKLQSFIFMPVFGLNNGLIPIVAYNYGAGNSERIKKAIRYSVCAACIYMFLGFLTFELAPEKLLMIFDASDNMIAMGIPALRIIALSFLLAGATVVVTGIFQALDVAVYSLVVSVLRQLIIVLPVAYILSKLVGLTGVWVAYPIAEIFAFIISIFLYKKTLRKRVDKQ